MQRSWSQSKCDSVGQGTVVQRSWSKSDSVESLVLPKYSSFGKNMCRQIVFIKYFSENEQKGIALICCEVTLFRNIKELYFIKGCRDCMVFGLTTTHAISACLWREVLDPTLCDKVCQ
jgi:hypothetical protein